MVAVFERQTAGKKLFVIPASRLVFKEFFRAITGVRGDIFVDIRHDQRGCDSNANKRHDDTVDADPAGTHGDDFAIAGEPRKAVKHSQQ